jgi:hypothetical protein
MKQILNQISADLISADLISKSAFICAQKKEHGARGRAQAEKKRVV